MLTQESSFSKFPREMSPLIRSLGTDDLENYCMGAKFFPPFLVMFEVERGLNVSLVDRDPSERIQRSS